MIYLDNAATTKPYDGAVELYAKLSGTEYFNPSALYGQSVEVSSAIRKSRDSIKRMLGADDRDELYFTSGGTEGDNWALFRTKKKKGSRVIVSEGEHDAVINPANELKMQGFDVVYAPIGENGGVDYDEFVKLLNEDVSLVSVMHVSNETGAINDIAKLVRAVRRACPDAVFHSDGVQAFGKIPVNVRALGVDLYTLSGHKIHAPKGIGALYVRNGVSLKPLLLGGGQEKGMRSGTENYPMIAAFEYSAGIKSKNAVEYSKNGAFLEHLKAKLLEKLPDTVVISPSENCSPQILTVAFQGVRGEVLLHTLEKHGVLVGIGSACSSHHESRFKKLLGLDDLHRDGIVRFSSSEFNTLDEVRQVVDAVAEEIAVLKQYGRK